MANATTIRERGSDGIEFTAAMPASQPGDVFPAGVMLHYAGSAAPSGWLLCDGTVVSRATYPNLFSAIGTTFGAGDGSTTFGLPDTRGRSVVAKHSSGTFTVLGATGGAETHQLTAAQMPSHAHSVSATTGTESADHTHAGTFTIFNSDRVATDGGIGNGAKIWGSAGSVVQIWGSNMQASGTTGGRSAAHTHSFSTTSGGAGSDNSHNNMHPYIVLNHIIRAY